MINRSQDQYSVFSKENYKNGFKTTLKNDFIVISVYMFVYVNILKEKKDNFIEKKLSNISRNVSNNYKLIGNNYYEWRIENWDKIKYNCEAEYSVKFNVCGYNWKIKMYPNGVDDSNDHISLYLKNLDVGSIKTHIFVKCVLFMANYDDYDTCHVKEFSSTFSSNKNTSGVKEFILKNQLYGGYDCKRTLITNNKVVVGAYVNVYEYNEVDCIINDIKESLEKKKTVKDEVIEENYYEWTIDNWKKFKDNKKVVYSPEFEIGGYNWRIFLYPNGNSKSKEYLSLYLHSKDVKSNSLLHISANYSLYIRNYKNYSCCHSYESESSCCFRECYEEHGSNEFIKVSDLYVKNKINNTTFVENNKLVIGAYISIFRFRKDQFIQEIKDIIYKDNYNKDDIKEEKFFEWYIDNWSNLKNDNVLLSPSFNNSKDNFSWKLKLYPNGCKKRYNDHISFFLHNINVMRKEIPEEFNIYADVMFFIRNVNDYSCHYLMSNNNMTIINKYNNYSCIREFIEKSKVKSDENGHQGLIEDNKIVFGVYICQYKPTKFDKFVKVLKESIDDSKYRGGNVLGERFFEREIADWENESEEYDSFSKTFYFGDFQWEFELLPDIIKKKIGMQLTCTEFCDEKSEKRDAIIYLKTIFYIRNYKGYDAVLLESNISNDYMNLTRKANALIMKNFVGYKNLYSNGNRLLENNKLVFGCYIRIYKKKPQIKITNKDFTLEYQSKDKKNGGGILYHFDQNGDLDVKLYEYKVDNNNNIEYSKYDVEKLNTDDPKLKKSSVNQGKIDIANVISESDLEDSDLEEEKQKGTAAIAIGDYKAKESYEVDIKIGDKIVVYDWDYDDEYVKGIKLHDDEKKINGFSLFPKEYVRKFDEQFLIDLKNNKIKPPKPKPASKPEENTSNQNNQSMPQPTAQSTAQPTPQSTPQQTPQPTAQPAAQPTIQPVPQPVPQSAPQYSYLQQPYLQPSSQPYGQPPPSPHPQYQNAFPFQPSPPYPFAVPAYPQPAPGPYPQQPYGPLSPQPAPAPGQRLYPQQPYGQAPPAPLSPQPTPAPLSPQPTPVPTPGQELYPQQPYGQAPPTPLSPQSTPAPTPGQGLYPPLSPQPAPAPAPGQSPYPQQPYGQAPLSSQPASGLYPQPYSIPSPQPSPQPSPYQQPCIPQATAYPPPPQYSVTSPPQNPSIPTESPIQASAPSSDNI
ncbi:hypothetical protein BCR36DRAFT_22785 [Piromyces finnis]|uniref:MATH domain-containing protein n=1 Tax=Piromyces finnis TaxID=1754191 RepID=A0A1Y1UL17_9FUNG|nr:hypothetical protein BCR36DRAFT_22785 [Piromyces finnis]|eukprot:ORX38750.1 hypothetical protein BCR36DRAFT_22785 [Piromyces finnis]